MVTRWLSIGVDVGGTNTDAVLLDGNNIIAKFKATTSPDVTQGIVKAISGLFAKNPDLKKNVKNINIGTTHLLNSLIERKNLIKPIIIRLGAPFSDALPPMVDWPEKSSTQENSNFTEARKSLKEAIGDKSNIYIVDGGYQFNENEIRPLNENELQRIALESIAHKVSSVAITGIFSILNPKQEEEAGAIFKKANPSIHVSLSHTLGELGLLARENATILNASLCEKFASIKQAFKEAIQQIEINAPIFLTYGDGTKSNLEDPSSTPLRTLNSGPINSIRGAALLTQLEEAITIDIGGTSSDLGILKKGEPANESSHFLVEGVNCNFPSARLHSFGLGGGTKITINEQGEIQIGPESVGSNLSKEGLVYGGNQLTPTDIAVVLGRLKLQTSYTHDLKSRILKFIEKTHFKDNIELFIHEVDKAIHKKLSDGINQILDSLEDIPDTLVLVGGGAVLVDFEKHRAFLTPRLKKIKILGPDLNGDVANALGAAKSLIGAKVVRVYSYQNLEETKKIAKAREYAIGETEEEAKRRAKARGADENSIKRLSLSETHFNYLPGTRHQVSIMVAGNDSGRIISNYEPSLISSVKNDQLSPEQIASMKRPENKSSSEVYKKLVSTIQLHGVEELTTDDIDNIALGAGLLGSGGGGNPEMGRQLTRLEMRKGIKVYFISPDKLPDEAFTVTCGLMGSPVVGGERLFSLQEGVEAVQKLEREMNRKIDAIVVAEGGGTNALYPFFVAARLGIPVVDADCMGRAFPLLNMVTPVIHEKIQANESKNKNEQPKKLIKAVASVSNGQEAKFVTGDNDDFYSLEEKARAEVVNMGGTLTLAILPMTGKEVKDKQKTLHGTLSTAREMGKSLKGSYGKPLNERLEALNKVLEKTDYKKAERVFDGKITHLKRYESGGFSFGGIIVQNLDNRERVEIGFQNENLMVQKRERSGQITRLATVPDLITIVDKNTFNPICCEDLKYAQDVVILKLSSPQIWKTPEGLEIVGPDSKAYQMEKISGFLESFK